MPMRNLSTLSDSPGERPTLLKAVRDTTATTDSDENVTGVSEVLTSVGKTVRDAVALGLGSPAAVVVTEHGCVAQLDTDGVLAWSVLFVTRRPIVATPPEIPGYLTLTGEINGHMWQLNNGTSVTPAAAGVA